MDYEQDLISEIIQRLEDGTKVYKIKNKLSTDIIPSIVSSHVTEAIKRLKTEYEQYNVVLRMVKISSTDFYREGALLTNNGKTIAQIKSERLVSTPPSTHSQNIINIKQISKKQPSYYHRNKILTAGLFGLGSLTLCTGALTLYSILPPTYSNPPAVELTLKDQIPDPFFYGNFELPPPVLKSPNLEEKIFTYHKDTTSDGEYIIIDTKIPGVGISQYVAAMVKNGWDLSSLKSLTNLELKEQEDLVRVANTAHIQSLQWDGVASIIKITKDVIDRNLDHELNPRPVIHNVDLSTEGLKDGKKNIIYPNTNLIVNIPNPPKREFKLPVQQNNATGSLEERILSPTEKLFEFQRLNKEILGIVSKDLYNTAIARAVEPYRTREERLELARSLYEITADKHSSVYMTVKEVLAIANTGLEHAITSKDLVIGSYVESRKVLLERSVSERRQAVLQKSLSYSPQDKKANLVRELAQEYGVSTSTIYRDLNKCAVEAPEPTFLRIA